MSGNPSVNFSYLCAAVSLGAMTYFLGRKDAPPQDIDQIKKMAYQVSERDPKLLEKQKKMLEEIAVTNKNK